mmetsp:Transcript_13222/g.38412  ORF Transcript_13222/g.38412 Transcript_13222/m.38412 type:complete len:312 (-) Transcript_13222:431-1366(-)
MGGPSMGWAGIVRMQPEGKDNLRTSSAQPKCRWSQSSLCCAASATASSASERSRRAAAYRLCSCPRSGWKPSATSGHTTCTSPDSRRTKTANCCHSCLAPKQKSVGAEPKALRETVTSGAPSPASSATRQRANAAVVRITKWLLLRGCHATCRIVPLATTASRPWTWRRLALACLLSTSVASVAHAPAGAEACRPQEKRRRAWTAQGPKATKRVSPSSNSRFVRRSSGGSAAAPPLLLSNRSRRKRKCDRPCSSSSRRTSAAKAAPRDCPSPPRMLSNGGSSRPRYWATWSTLPLNLSKRAVTSATMAASL